MVDDDHGRTTVPQLSDDRTQAFQFLAGKTNTGFVEQHHRQVADRCARDVDELMETDRDFLCARVRILVEAERLQLGGSYLQPLRLRLLWKDLIDANENVLQHRHVADQPRNLERAAHHFRALMNREGRNRPARQADSTTVHRFDARQDVEQGRLAGPVWA